MSFLSKFRDAYEVVAKILTPKEMADRRREENESTMRSYKLTRKEPRNTSPDASEKDLPSFMREVKNPADAKKFQKELEIQEKKSKQKSKTSKPKKGSGIKPLTAPRKPSNKGNFDVNISDPKLAEDIEDLAGEIANAFRPYHMRLEFGDGYINISRADGIHCEFYGSMEALWMGMTGTYSIDGEEQDLDYSLPDDLNQFVRDVADILMVRKSS